MYEIMKSLTKHLTSKQVVLYLVILLLLNNFINVNKNYLLLFFLTRSI